MRRTSPTGNEHGWSERRRDERHDEVYAAWQCAGTTTPPAYRATNPVKGRRIAEKVLASLPTCPIPGIRRLGQTLKQWRAAFLA